VTGNDRLGVYWDIASSLNRVRSERSLNGALGNILSETLGFAGLPCGLIRIEAGGGKIYFAMEVGNGKRALCFEGLAAPDCVCKEALSGGADAVVVSGDFKRPDCNEAGWSQVVCAPIRVGGKNCGIFFAASPQKTAPSREAVKLIGLVCASIGDTVERVWNDKKERQRSADMETVNTIGRLITSKLTLEDMVHEIVSKLGGVLETDEVNVILYDETRRELSFLASYFASGSGLDRPEVYPISDGINSWIIKNRLPLLMTHDTLTECARLGIRHGGRPAKSWLGAPMIYKDRVVGVVSVQSYSKTGLYDQDSVTLIGAVANQCAVAVENARLFKDVIAREAEKERLYFSLTHDLLSLISPVAGFVKIFKSLPPGAPEESRRNLADNVIAATDKITRFAEDILVYAKINSGKLALDISRCDTYTPLDSAVRVYLPELEMRKISTFVNGRPITINGIERPDPIMADMDKGQMERVFINCIGNAVKHARSEIKIDIEESNSRITCRVRDNGDGVASELCDQLFDEFYQAGAKKKGVGLGLPSVKKIIQLHDGTIHIESDTGAGFVIEFSWPRTLADRHGPGQARRPVI